MFVVGLDDLQGLSNSTILFPSFMCMNVKTVKKKKIIQRNIRSPEACEIASIDTKQ